MSAATPLRRSINRSTLVLMVVNSIIGAGIFGLPSKIFALAGSYSLLAFAVCAVVVLIFVGCFAEVSTRFQQTGGPYTYILSAFGKGPAFGMGWLLLLSRMFNYAALINLLVTYFFLLAPSLDGGVARVLIISTLTLLLAAINYVGVNNAARFSNVFTIAKLAPLTVFIVAGLLYTKGDTIAQIATPPATSSFSQAVLLLIFAFGGFESVLINTGEIKAPQKNLPVALLSGIAIVTSFYCLIQVVCMGALPSLAASATPVADAAKVFLGAKGALVIVLGAVISIIGTLNVLMLSGSRLPYAFSNEQQLPPVFAKVHQRFATPHISLLVFAAATLAVSLAWGFLSAITIGAMIRLLVYAMVCL